MGVPGLRVATHPAAKAAHAVAVRPCSVGSLPLPVRELRAQVLPAQAVKRTDLEAYVTKL